MSYPDHLMMQWSTDEIVESKSEPLDYLDLF